MNKHDTSARTAGWDWSTTTHAVSVVDHEGVERDRMVVDHTAAGLARATRWLHRQRVSGIGIERPDGPIIQALQDAALEVFVIPPRQMHKLRGRYGSTGNKDDRFDAFVLADTLRTDRRRLRPLQPDSPATVALRRTCRARRDLVGHRIALSNQLYAHLQLAFPGGIGLFADLDSPISLAFLRRFPSQDQADWLTETRLAAWLRSVSYRGRKHPAVLHRHLTDAPRGITGTTAQVHAQITLAYIDSLHATRTQVAALQQRIAHQLDQHPDGAIFTSFPRAGVVRAATLLAEMGDCRARFPDPDSLQGLAGICPSTRQSGNHKAVVFRWSCDKRLRNAITDFVSDTRHVNPWAAALYNRAIARHHDHPHAERILARAWSYVIWRCWQDHTPYDESRHRALEHLDDKAAA